MKKTLLILVLIFILFSCSKEEQVIPEDYSACEPTLVSPEISKLHEGFIEFDIIPDKLQNRNNKGAAVKSKLWTKGIMPFYFRDWSRSENGLVTMGFDEEEREKIRSIIKEFEETTGLLLPEYESKEGLLKDFPNGIEIIPSPFNNSSYVAMQGGIQKLSITFGIVPHHVKHELLHAAGLLHEFTRSDRDEHLIVHYDNIPSTYHRQYDVYGGGVHEGYDCGNFDFKSIMMYPSFKVGIDTTKPTMTTLDGETWEMNTKLSKGDIKTVQALYKNEFAKR